MNTADRSNQKRPKTAPLAMDSLPLIKVVGITSALTRNSLFSPRGVAERKRATPLGDMMQPSQNSFSPLPHISQSSSLNVLNQSNPSLQPSPTDNQTATKALSEKQKASLQLLND